jgi:tetratricopeptide (TPR) repeat protein
MMSSSSDHPSQTVNVTSPGPVVVRPDIADLHAEIGVADNPGAKSVLLYELGLLEERLDDDMGAAREYLAAFNAQPEFREPLEGLLRILERRKSVRNLTRLLEALERAAETPDERARALLKRAGFASDHLKDDGLARTLLEGAVEIRPDEIAAWLELEVLGGRTGDAELRGRALDARAHAAVDPTWKALLLIDLGALLGRAGEADRAMQVIEEATELASGARFAAYRALESLGRRENKPDAVARGLEGQADLIVTALGDAAAGEGSGVPVEMRRPEAAADALWRASELRRQEGDGARAAALLDRAIELLPDERVLAQARMSIAELSGDTATAASIAKRLIDRGTTGSAGASLWLRVAEAHAHEGDLTGALGALAHAIELDAACIPARALQIDLLAGRGDAAALASALESMGAELPTDEGKGRAYLLAALVHAIFARDASGSKAALSQAGMFGAPATLLARAARLFAAVLEDASWYEEATRRLLSSGADASEQPSLWFELGRQRLLRGDDDGGLRAFESLAQNQRGQWLGRALAAYAVGLRPDANGKAGAVRPADALEKLGQNEPDRAMARAYALGAARRAHIAGDRDSAIAKLSALFDEQPADPLVAIYLAELLRNGEQPLEAARVLASSAAALGQTDLAGAIEVEAAALRLRAGDKRGAIDALRGPADAGIAGAAEWIVWIERAVDPSDSETRRRSLGTERTREDARLGLERFALETLDPNGDETTTETTLEQLEDHASGNFRTAADLARLLIDDGSIDRPRVDRALERLEGLGAGAEPLARAERLRIARADGDSEQALEAAQSWAEKSPSVDATIEWVAAAASNEDRASEARGRRRLAAQLSTEGRALLRASSAMLALVDDPTAAQHLLEDDHPAARLMNLELASLGSNPHRRSAVLTGIGNALGDDGPRLDGLTLAGFNQLAAGEVEAALVSFEEVAEARPDDLFAWEGVRSAAEGLGDQERRVVACMNLGRLSTDSARGAEFWEQAGLALTDPLGRPEQAELAFEQAFARDATRTVSFDRLFRRVRDRKDGDKMLALIERRLEVAEEPGEIAKLFWEQARVLRQKGDREGALSALRNVTMIESDHVGALALSGEIFIGLGQFAEAADALSRLSTLPEAPEKQRLMSGVAAVDLYENKLDQDQRALEVLTTMHKSGLSTPPVRERIARLATKLSAWPEATQMLEQLMAERATPEGRVEAARLAMSIWREKLSKPERAVKAAVKLLEERPDDGQALDFVLGGNLPHETVLELLARGRQAIVRALGSNPTDREKIDRLSRIASAIDDAPLRQATLGALVSVWGTTPELERELGELDRRVARLPRMALDTATFASIADPGDTGPLAELFAVLAAPIAEALGPSLAVLGVTKKNKVDPRSGLPLRNEVAAWAGALGLGEFDLYIGGNDARAITCVPGEIPSLVVGASIESPITAATRQAIVRELFALRRGTSIARTRDETTVAAIFVATCRVAELPVQAPPYAMLEDVQRQLGRVLSRRTKKLATDICGQALAVRQDARAFAKAALYSMDRMAAIAAGDVSLVLADSLGCSRSELGGLVQHDERAKKLLAFVLSSKYLELRNQLGMGVR